MTAFSVLTVCTGNICRSPLAEQLLRARLEAAGVPVSVSSAGTRALVDHDMTLQAAELAGVYGASPATHAARLLTEPLIADADLVLTASREHRAEVVSQHPRASRYTFTLNQFARLVTTALAEGLVPGGESDDPADRLRDFVRAAAALRGTVQPSRPEDDDIIDPYRQSQDVYDQAGEAINAAVNTITVGLTEALGVR
ncbi:arsenate reductase/protein-tyrosine-phosphatase family protein [Cryobacterium tepidiphilum]|uniref:Low molecular weight phosphatase family protein n=1 Tax=Cryobacterium tepidiphilum TaxID=2486026 RepID=A0A3M8LD52_9MICO|nr:low molecular weight phosphatase family protein [Cryobacterium tepidiphilum]RNE62594.1 low molecular weight phosphatase family protein [Cryobacterium tepidiphilum]